MADYQGALTGQEIDALPGKIGNLSALQTTAKGSLVEAVNDIVGGGTEVEVSRQTYGIATEDNVIVTDKAVITTTGGDKDINSSEEGFTAHLASIKGASKVTGDFVHSAITNNYAPTEETEYDFYVTVEDRDKFTAAVIENGLAGNNITLATVQSWLSLDYGLASSGTPVGTETFTVTDPIYQTVDFPQITSFNSTSWNLLTSGNTAGVIKGHRYMIRPSDPDVAPTAEIGSVAQTLEAYTCSRGHLVPFTFVATATGDCTLTGASIVALVWSGKHCDRTTNTEYSLSTISIPAAYQTLRAIGNVCDELTPTSYRKRISSVPMTGENLVITANMERIVTSTYIYYVDDLQVAALSLDWSFTANDFGEMYFVFGGSVVMPIEFTAIYGANLVDKLARDVLTKSSQTLTNAEKAQVHTNLGLQHTVFTVTYTDGSTGAVNIVGYVE